LKQITIEKFLKGKRVALVFGDPAGAKAMIAAFKLFSLRHSAILLSDRQHSFYTDLSVNVVSVSSVEDLFIKLDLFGPQIILTGTSYPDSIEIHSLKYAQSKKIESASFIDHWTNMKVRFIDKNGTTRLPDVIFVIDKVAFDFALKEGLPSEKISISKNPYYTLLESWRPVFDRSSINALLNFKQQWKYIVFAPEPLAKFNLEKKYGFNEYDVLKDINHIISSLNMTHDYKIRMVYKTHPNITLDEVSNSIRFNLGTIPEYIHLVDKVDINHLMFYSSGVFGFFSNSLIEASFMGTPTFRILYKLENGLEDPLLGLNIGVCIDSLDKLSNEIHQIFTK
jgi:hypothetical protein